MKKSKKNGILEGTLNINRVFINRANGQISVLLPRRKLKCIPIKLKVSYWGKNDI